MDQSNICLVEGNFEWFVQYMDPDHVFVKLSPDELEEAEVLALKTSPFIIKPHTKLKNVWTTIIRNLDDRLENLLMHGSGWSLTEVSCVITD